MGSGRPSRRCRRPGVRRAEPVSDVPSGTQSPQTAFEVGFGFTSGPSPVNSLQCCSRYACGPPSSSVRQTWFRPGEERSRDDRVGDDREVEQRRLREQRVADEVPRRRCAVARSSPRAAARSRCGTGSDRSSRRSPRGLRRRRSSAASSRPSPVSRTCRCPASRPGRSSSCAGSPTGSGTAGSAGPGSGSW